VIKVIQRFQSRIQQGMVTSFASGRVFRLPWLLRLILKIPGLRDIPPRVPAFGVRRVRIERTDELPLASAAIVSERR
jgi:hypothetical protein